MNRARRLAAELLIGLVNHTRNGTIAAQREPSDAIFCTHILLLLVLIAVFIFHYFFGHHHGVFLEQAAKPCVVGAEEMELRVEEYVETGHPDLEEFGEKEMPSLMQQHEE